MKTILVLTDFSIKAGFAAEYATHFAIENKVNIVLCNVQEVAVSPGFDGDSQVDLSLNQVIRDESLLDLLKEAKHLEKIVLDSDNNFKPLISTVFLAGPLVQVLKDIVIDKGIDLIIIGSHKSTDLARFIYGSHTYSLLDGIDCPLLLVPECLKFKGVTRIIYATDITFDNTKVLNYLVEIANNLGAEISVNHISPTGVPISKYERSVGLTIQNNLSPEHPPVVYNNIRGDDVKNSLLESISTGNVNMIVLVHKQYDWFENLFHSSITKKMANTAAIPLLVMPNSFNTDIPNMTNKQLDEYCYETDSR